MVSACADEGRSFFSPWVPFFLDELKSWPSSEPIVEGSLARAVREKWGVPPVPAHVLRPLLELLDDQGFVFRSSADGGLHPDREALSALHSLTERSEEVHARLNELFDAVVKHARARHGVNWSHGEVNRSLEAFIEQFGPDLALARRRGGVADLPRGFAGTPLDIVHGFALHAYHHDSRHWDQLLDMVRGAMLVNSLYLPGGGELHSRLPRLGVALDTTVALRALGVAAEPLHAATQEVVDLLHAVGASVFLLPQTLDEVHIALERLVRKLKRPRRHRLLGEQACQDQEALDGIRAAGWTVRDLEELRANLEPRLATIGVTLRSSPPPDEHRQIDEGALRDVLDRVVAYHNPQSRDRDILSLSAVDKLRGGVSPRDLEQTLALLVTTNPLLTRASCQFFGEEERSPATRHCVLERDLAGQLWVRSGHARPELPKTVLIAHCWAASRFSSEFWARCNEHMERLDSRAEHSEDDLLRLIHDAQTRLPLFGASERNILGDYGQSEAARQRESELRESAEREAERARKRAEEAEAACEEAQAARGIAKQRAVTAETNAADLRRQLEVMRMRVGTVGAMLTALTFVSLALVGGMHGRLGWAIGVSALILISAGCWAWGRRLSWTLPFKVLMVAGALSGLGFAIYGVVPGSHHDKSPHPRGAHHSP